MIFVASCFLFPQCCFLCLLFGYLANSDFYKVQKVGAYYFIMVGHLSLYYQPSGPSSVHSRVHLLKA
jgi:hypothetical protein